MSKDLSAFLHSTISISYDEYLLTAEVKEFMTLVEQKDSPSEETLAAARLKLGLARAPSGRVSVRSYTGEWFNIKPDSQAAGVLVLQNSSGYCFVLPRDPGNKLIQLDLSDDLVFAQLFSNMAWEDLLQPISRMDGDSGKPEPLILTSAEFRDTEDFQLFSKDGLTQQANRSVRTLQLPTRKDGSTFDTSSCTKKATLGARRTFLSGAALLWSTIEQPIRLTERATASEEQNSQPLLIYDPDEPTESHRKELGYRAVHVAAFISAQLRPHQQEGVRFMFWCLAGLHEGGAGCILCDGMGLGKSFQSIAILWTLLTTGLKGSPTCSKPLILCPSSLVNNWGKEMHRWLGDRVDAVMVDDTRGGKVVELLSTFGLAGNRARKPQVLVMSYTTFRIHSEAVYKKGIDIVVCDEAHQLKNLDSQITRSVLGLPATRRLLLSGTPIQNDLTEFYTLIHVAVPDILGTIYAFHRTYENPGAQEYLPAKVEQVVFCRMSGLQQALYRSFLASPPVIRALKGSAKERKADGGAQLSVLAAITALKKLCCHPDLIHQMLGISPQSTAGGFRIPVRRLSTGSQTASTPRATSVGKASAASTSESTKSVISGFEGCGSVFQAPEVYPAYSADACQPYHSGKVMVLESMLKATRASEPTDKVVLVSNYTEVLNVLQKMCTSHQWGTLRLDGSCAVKTRQSLQSRGGVGLNIIGANRLVLFDGSWNPAEDLQAMARVWREGQKKQVWIYRLLTTGSIEEKVYQRQMAKQGLSKSIVDTQDNQSRQFSTEELRGLFKVDPQVVCDTHTAIKCKCKGGLEDMQHKHASNFRDAGSSSAGASTELADGIQQWAHLASPVDSPDSTWRNIPSFVRDRFITYLFSDHIVNGPPPQRSRHGVEEGEMDDDEQEDHQDVGLGKGTVYGDCEMGNDDCDSDGGDERRKRQESEDPDRSEEV
ncbi:MAG: hypothetical protein WDW38_008516 [Sanguina aurantia]